MPGKLRADGQQHIFAVEQMLRNLGIRILEIVAVDQIHRLLGQQLFAPLVKAMIKWTINSG